MAQRRRWCVRRGRPSPRRPRLSRKLPTVVCGRDLPIAITLGNDPVISIVASTPMEYDQNEYELTGALRGEPAPIAKSPLHGLPVPWGSEVVIEGVIEGRKREIEGPSGDSPATTPVGAT